MAKKKGIGKIGTGQKIMLLLLLVVLATVAYYMIFYREKAGRLDSLKKEYDALTLEEQDWVKRQKTYIQDVEDLNRRKERQREQIRILPPDSEMSSFLMDLDNLAGLAGLEIEMLEPKDEQGAGFYAKIPVTLQLSGKFHQVLKFFYSVGKLERIINIENIKFKDVKVEGTDVKVKAEVEAMTFRSLEAPGTPGAAKAGGV
jgi:type IV pilus assembly protein PilO